MRNLLTTLLLLAIAATPAFAVFTDSGQVNNQYDRTDPALAAWASGVAGYQAGPMDYKDPGAGTADYGFPTDVLGDAGSIFSLGDGGWITLTFPAPIIDGPGDDLVVFENGFEYNGGVFMELGFVEVSSDGETFARMPALCRHDVQPGPWDVSPAGDFYNLAGNFVGGTGFDLADLAACGDSDVLSGAVDLQNITHVRIVDVIGDIADGGATRDFLGRAVADPYPTASASCGMDLTGVAVINAGDPVAGEMKTWGGVKELYR